MKKLICLIVVFFGGFFAYSQSLQIFYEFEFAYLPTGAMAGYTVSETYFYEDGKQLHFVIPDLNSYINDFHITFGIEFLFFNKIFISGKMGTVFGLTVDSLYAIQGLPTFLDSLFNAGLRYGNLEIGITRYCQHPVVPSAHSLYISTLKGEVSWGQFYFKLSGKF